MNSLPHRCWIDGIALWTPSLPDWATACGVWSGQSDPPPAAGTQRPAPTLLAANERRRAPDSVLLALEVAGRAATASGHDAAMLATVFASAHGDLPITDALCRTLAGDPRLLSPTRFHHSVHNAASGYWAIGAGAHAASTALSAHEATVAVGWLEAATQVACDGQPVMLVAYDTEATGPLCSVNTSCGLLAAALVLAPAPGPASRWAVCWGLEPQRLADDAPTAPWGTPADNASAAVLPLLAALAAGQPCDIAWPLSPSLALRLRLEPLADPASAG